MSQNEQRNAHSTLSTDLQRKESLWPEQNKKNVKETQKTSV